MKLEPAPQGRSRIAANYVSGKMHNELKHLGVRHLAVLLCSTRNSKQRQFCLNNNSKYIVATPGVHLQYPMACASVVSMRMASQEQMLIRLLTCEPELYR